MKFNEELKNHIPTITTIIDRAEGRIHDTTGVKLKLAIIEVHDIATSDSDLLKIAMDCCNIWGKSYHELLKHHRKQHVVCMRKVIARIIKHNYPATSLTRMASLLGLDDHSSVIHLLKSGNDLLDVFDPLFMSYYLPVKTLLNEPEPRI